tara:strand:- start:150 stop:401 length:252 start_codon:yes stop_codon:yes gene_type:complete
MYLSEVHGGEAVAMAEWGTKMGAEMEREKADGDGGVKAIAAAESRLGAPPLCEDAGYLARTSLRASASSWKTLTATLAASGGR